MRRGSTCCRPSFARRWREWRCTQRLIAGVDVVLRRRDQLIAARCRGGLRVGDVRTLIALVLDERGFQVVRANHQVAALAVTGGEAHVDAAADDLEAGL